MHTFARMEGRKQGGWEEDNKMRAGLFTTRTSEIQKIQEEEEEVADKKVD